MIRRMIAAVALLLAPAAAAQTVTQPQAQAAAAQATSYFAPGYGCDATQPDGFNPGWYAHARPDVVKAWGGTLLSHYQAYGKREGTPPCDTTAPALVSTAAAKGAVATLATYAGQAIVTAAPTPTTTPAPTSNPAWAAISTNEDGFNPAWYAHLRPDVVASGADLLTHYLQHGRFEGSAPYQGGPLWTQVGSPALARLPAPLLSVPDVYVPAGSTSAVVTAYLTRDGKPSERSADLDLVPQGQFSAAAINTDVLPSTGSRKQWRVTFPAWYTAQGGAALVAVRDRADNPNSGLVQAHIHLGETPPAGYAYVDALNLVSPQPPAIINGPATYDDDLTDLAGRGWLVGGGGGYALNGMTGYFPAPGTKTLSGKVIDPVPLVSEGGVTFRRFLEQDFRRDPFPAANGMSGWAMGSIQRADIPAYVVIMVRERLNRYLGMDMATLWGIGEPLPLKAANQGYWPPERDDDETWADSDKQGLQFENWHLPPDGAMTGQGVYGVPEGVWIDRLIQRTRASDEPGGLAMYRQWVRLAGSTGAWRLTVEHPDYLAGVPIGITICNEGWHGNEPALGATPWDAVANHAYFDIGRVRFWVPAGIVPTAANDNQLGQLARVG